MADLAAIATNEHSGPIFFYKAKEEYGFLNQFFPSSFTALVDESNDAEKITFKTVEHFMNYRKSQLFGEGKIAELILKVSAPFTTIELGRQVGNRGKLDTFVWAFNRLQIVEEGNYAKFTRSDNADWLQAQLLATGTRDLVYANPGDKVLGIGINATQAAMIDGNGDRSAWGHNLLGKILMRIRKQIRLEEREKETGQLREIEDVAEAAAEMIVWRVTICDDFLQGEECTISRVHEADRSTENKELLDRIRTHCKAFEECF